MITIVDYGVGNLFSLKSSFAKIGIETEVTGDKTKIQNAERIILPGVGAFGAASDKLKETGLFDVVKEEAKKGKYLMGICLGMQLLLEKGFEYGEYEGLGLIKGEVRPISETIEPGLKIPQIGWNALKFENGKSPIFKYINEGDCVYFVHSYHGMNVGQDLIATTEYGGILTAAVGHDNIFGCQFHPEKSGNVGLNILKAFNELEY